MNHRWIRAEWPAPTAVIAGTILRTGSSKSLPGRPCFLNQVHGADVVAAGEYDTPPNADASVSRDPAHVCVVRTADCLPVLFCATDGSEIAAAHAGWRGLAAGILENTLEAMEHDPAQIMAWLGPAISQPNFEIGAEVREAFVGRDPGAEACFQPNARGRWQADLYGLARRELRAAGVTRISGGELCTFADRERFFSYRRNPDCGRMISFVGLK